MIEGASAAAAGPRVLLVSERLGTPGWHDSWQDYSVAVLEILKSFGADVTLVVERAFGFDVPPCASTDRAGNEARLSAVQDFLVTGSVNTRLYYRGPLARLLALYAPALLRGYAIRAHRRALARETMIPNGPRQGEPLPDRLAYLHHLDGFLFPKRFYSAANLRAVYDTGPAEIDGTGYDLVVVDGLLPVRVTGATPAKIVTIVHDMSAVCAPDTRMKTRLIAGQALVQMAEHRGTVVFATEDARTRFEALAGKVPRRASLVLGPVMSERVRRLASELQPTEPSAYLAALEAKIRKAAFLRSVSPKGILERLAQELVSEAAAAGATRPEVKDVPTIVIVWPSDAGEAIRFLVKLANELTGSAKLVALGAKLPPPPLLAKVVGPAPLPPPDLPPNLHLVDALPELDRLDVIRHAALVIYPERAGAGSKLLEAVALNASIMCFDTAANREFLGKARASLVPPKAGSLVPFILASLSDEEAVGPSRGEAQSELRPPPSARADDVFRELLKPNRSLTDHKATHDG